MEPTTLWRFVTSVLPVVLVLGGAIVWPTMLCRLLIGLLAGVIVGPPPPPLPSLLLAPLSSPAGLAGGKEVPSAAAPSPPPPAASSPGLVGTLKCLAILPMPIIFRRASRMASLLLESVASAGIITASSPTVSPPSPPDEMPVDLSGGCEGGKGCIMGDPACGSSMLALPDENASEELSWMGNIPMGGCRGGRRCWPLSSSYCCGVAGGGGVGEGRWTGGIPGGRRPSITFERGGAAVAAAWVL